MGRNTAVLEEARNAGVRAAGKLGQIASLPSIDAAMGSLLDALYEQYDTTFSPQAGYGDIVPHPADLIEAMQMELGDATN